MAFDGINGILGAGRGKTANRGKQGRDQELIGPYQRKEKISGAFLQKIFHYLLFPASGLPGQNIVPVLSNRVRDRNLFLLKQRLAGV